MPFPSRRTAVTRLVGLALLAWVSASATVATELPAQTDARLEVTLPARAIGGGDGPAFAPRSVLASRELRELLRGGFPARLRFRCELWRDERFNNQLDAAVEWDMLVRFDQLTRKFEVYRIVGDRASQLGRFDTPEEAEALIEKPFRIMAPPMRRRVSYYYDASLDVEVLSLSDLEEVERWLRGEVRPALTSSRSAGTAVTRTIRSFFVRLLGGERRHYETQTRSFTAE